MLLFEEPVIPVADAEHETSDDEESQKARADAHERDSHRLPGANWPAAAQCANPHPDREGRQLARDINLAFFTCF